MKAKEWGIIGIIVIVSAMLSFVVANLLLGGSKAPKLTSPKVEPISADFPLPNEKYFNNKALNPTQEIKIGEDNNQDPFKGQ